jgi:hypothetical protein
MSSGAVRHVGEREPVMSAETFDDERLAKLGRFVLELEARGELVDVRQAVERFLSPPDPSTP